MEGNRENELGNLFSDNQLDISEALGTENNPNQPIPDNGSDTNYIDSSPVCSAGLNEHTYALVSDGKRVNELENFISNEKVGVNVIRKILVKKPQKKLLLPGAVLKTKPTKKQLLLNTPKVTKPIIRPLPPKPVPNMEPERKQLVPEAVPTTYLVDKSSTCTAIINKHSYAVISDVRTLKDENPFSNIQVNHMQV